MSEGYINAKNFSEEISKYLEEYKGDITEAVNESLKEALKYGVKELKEKSPKKTGEYSKEWVYKLQKTGRSINGTQVQGVIFNNVYQLTHLLEFGHANRNGGRTAGIKHIEPAEEKSIKKFEEGILSRL